MKRLIKSVDTQPVNIFSLQHLGFLSSVVSAPYQIDKNNSSSALYELFKIVESYS